MTFLLAMVGVFAVSVSAMFGAIKLGEQYAEHKERSKPIVERDGKTFLV